MEAIALKPHPFNPLVFARKAIKRMVLLGLACWFIPIPFAVYFCVGLLDVLRNRRCTLETVDRYFAGNGFFTWLLAPFNLLMDVLCLPFANHGIYRLGDLPAGHQEEIQTLIQAAHEREVVKLLEAQGHEFRRGMMFFKWYGKNVAASIDVPEFHQKFRYIRTIGISVFNKRQKTSKHFGPLRITLRVLYNINHIDSRDVYIRVGSHTHRWREEKLFIFDDTLQHQSVNESDEVRYCLFVDILRPSLFPRLLSAVLSCVRVIVARVNFAFYRQWTFIR
jgi:beta-hydroxylase